MDSLGQVTACYEGVFAFSGYSKRPVFSTEPYASDVRFFKTLELNEDRD
jgi:hypothetical protein